MPYTQFVASDRRIGSPATKQSLSHAYYFTEERRGDGNEYCRNEHSL